MSEDFSPVLSYMNGIYSQSCKTKEATGVTPFVASHLGTVAFSYLSWEKLGASASAPQRLYVEVKAYAQGILRDTSQGILSPFTSYLALSEASLSCLAFHCMTSS